MLHRLLDIFHSFLQIAFRIIFARKGQVLFYYPQHFNRSAVGTNPFFDPLLQTCEEAGISYKLLEEPDWGTDKSRNPRAIKADAFFVLVLILRKLVKLAGIKDFYAAEPHVARLVNILTFGRLRYRRYVTISGSMQFLFAAMNEDTRVYDMQHGILYKRHHVFFDENFKLRPHYYNKKLHWLVWGKGYYDTFVKNEESIFYDRVHLVGFPMKHSNNSNNMLRRSKTIIISLQFNPSYDKDTLLKEKKLLTECLDELQYTGYRILLKHHPRFEHCISLEDWFKHYNFIEETNESLESLSQFVDLHITPNSTASFDYARYKIPTYFLYNDERPFGKLIFYDEYAYPLYYRTSLRKVVSHIEDNKEYMEDRNIVYGWYKHFYSSFDKKLFIALVENEAT